MVQRVHLAQRIGVFGTALDLEAEFGHEPDPYRVVSVDEGLDPPGDTAVIGEADHRSDVYQPADRLGDVVDDAVEDPTEIALEAGIERGVQ